MIIAIDFDGTVVEHAYPNIGKSIGAEPHLEEWVKAGARLILFTMRDRAELEDAVQWYEEREIPLWGIQHNPSQYGWTSSVKPYANM